jgi:hypothetical protein
MPPAVDVPEAFPPICWAVPIEIGVCPLSLDERECGGKRMSYVAPYSIEERVLPGDTRWVAIRARGAEWSWLTPEEAVALGRILLAKYDQAETAAH